MECTDCNGYGLLENLWGYGDTDCCGTTQCAACNGMGIMADFEDEIHLQSAD